MREGKSDFLTNIAKMHDSRIKSVSFLPIPGMRGAVWKAKPPYDDGKIRIEINPNIACPHQILYTFFHEVGHVILGHFDLSPMLRTAEIQKEATNWAFGEMGVLDHKGKVKKANETCYHCIIQQSKICLKGLNITGGQDE